MDVKAGRFSGAVRLARGAVLGSAIVLLTVLGHTAGGQSTMADATSLVILWPLAVAFSLLAASTRRSAGWLFAFAVAVQALFHVLMSVMSAHAPHGAPGLPSPTMITGHLVAAALAAVVLAHGDNVMHRWLRFIGALAREILLPAIATPTHSVSAHRPPVLLQIRSILSSAICRRGPPLPAA